MNCNLEKKHPWLLLADVFKAQWTDDVKKLVSESNGKMVPIPNNMTHKFQPLDLTINRTCKAFLRKQAQKWYADEVSRQMLNGITPESVKVDVRINILKPLHAKRMSLSIIV